MKTNATRRISSPDAAGAGFLSGGLRLLLLAAALFTFGAPSSSAAPTSGPRMSNGYSVDWCLHWGVDCGKPAADEYCRRTGYPAGAASFTTALTSPTWVLDDGKICNYANYCIGFTAIQCATSSGNGAGPKMSNGYSVDWCLHWGVDCGKPAADEYCRRSGHPAGSASFSTGIMNPTWVLGDNKPCNEGYCVGFTSLQCSGVVTEGGPTSSLTGDWMLTTACGYPTTDKQSWWEVLTIGVREGHIAAIEKAGNLALDAPNAGFVVNQTGSQIQLTLSPAGWVSQLFLNGTIDGSRIDGAVTHYGRVDCNFTMTRK